MLLAATIVSIAPIAEARSIRDSSGKLVPGVYSVSTGSRFNAPVHLELFGDDTFRAHLRSVRDDLQDSRKNLLLTGRIEEDRGSRMGTEFQSFRLKIEKVWHIRENDRTILSEIPPTIASELEISLNLAKKPQAFGLFSTETALLAVNTSELHPGEYAVLITESVLPQPFRRLAKNPFERFEPALAPAPVCRGLFVSAAAALR